MCSKAAFLFCLFLFRVLQALKHHFGQRALQKLVEFINSVVAQWLACCRVRFFIRAENQLIQAAFKMLGYTDGNCQAYACLTVFQIAHVGLGNINCFCQALLRHLRFGAHLFDIVADKLVVRIYS